MTRKTLTVRPADERSESLPLERKGRGWAIAESRLDTLHDTARAMRRAPTEAQALLAQALIDAELGKFRFARQVVIGSAIVDFACQPLKLAVELDERDANTELDRRRDKSLAEVGIKVLRFPSAQVVESVETVVQAIIAELKARYDAQRSRPRAKPSSQSGAGRRTYQR